MVDMKLNELIEQMGEDVVWQNLDDAITRIQTKSDGQSLITFGTGAATTLNGTERIGIVVWLDRDKVEKAQNQ